MSLLLLFVQPTDAGVSQLEWKHGRNDHVTDMTVDHDGNVIVCGCDVSTAVAYVTKFAPSSEQLWHHTIAPLRCANAISSDENLNIYVTGSVLETEFETEDMALIKYNAQGQVEWTKTIGIPQYSDTSLSLHVVTDAIYMSGYSRGNLTLANLNAAAPVVTMRNCMNARDCEDGFLMRLTLEGEIAWIHQLASQHSDRIYDVDVDVDAGHVVLIGETYGTLSTTPDPVDDALHAGDLVVRKLRASDGAVVWTTQLRSAAATVADVCLFQGRGLERGRCSLVVRNDAIYLTGTTAGVLTTFPDDVTQYRDLCKRSSSSRGCVQTLVARLDLTIGRVVWIKQLLSKAYNTGHRVVYVPSQDQVVALGTTDAGLLSSDQLEQMMLWTLDPDGTVQWMRELGLDGTDQAAALSILLAQDESKRVSLLAAGYGSLLAEQSAGGGATSSLRRMNCTTGTQIPICIDGVSFKPNATRVRVEQQHNDSAFALVPVLRINERCGFGAASYRTMTLSSTQVHEPNETMAMADRDFIASSGVIRFPLNQKQAQIMVEILPFYRKDAEDGSLRSADGSQATNAFRLFSLVLEASSASSDSEILDPAVMTVEIEVYEPPVNSSFLLNSTTGNGTLALDATVAADGNFWRQLSWITFLVVSILLILVLFVGRFCAGCLRRGKVFQYKMVRLNRQKKSSTMLPSRTDPSSADALMLTTTKDEEDDENDEETEELRAHLEEIQQLNETLEDFVQTAALRKLTKENEESVPNPSISPLAPIAEVPASALVMAMSHKKLAMKSKPNALFRAKARKYKM